MDDSEGWGKRSALCMNTLLLQIDATYNGLAARRQYPLRRRNHVGVTVFFKIQFLYILEQRGITDLSLANVDVH
jgi:hypothetical protein